MRRRTLLITLACAAVLAATGLAWAQSPFGVGRPPAAAPGGLLGWMLLKQAEFYRALSGLIRAAKADGSAAWALVGVSFLYGIFHAAGPGHGKAVISSYLVANDETWRCGIVLSFAAALLQSTVAVAIVGIAAALLGATAKMMTDAVRVIEIASYALIAALGARLAWAKGRALLAALGTPRQPALAFAAEGHAHHDQAHHDHVHHEHAHDHHVHDAHCDHAHGPEPDELAGPGGWRRGLTAIVAVGLRPCSGAILVLVFALAQGLFWAGVAATFVMGLGTALTVAAIATLAVAARGLAGRLAQGRGGGTLALRALEVAAAVLVFAFGVLLLLGYMASERLGMA